MKLFDKNKIHTLLRILFAVMVIFAASGCSDDDAIDAYKEYKTMSSADAFDVSECFYCKIFILTFNAMGDVAARSVEQTRGGALTLLAMTYAIWLLMQMFVIFTGVKTVDLREQWSKILIRTFFLLIASTFLYSDDNMAELYGFTMIPVMEAATDLSVEYANIASNAGVNGVGNACNNMAVPPAAGLVVIPREMGEKFACVLLNVNQVIYKLHLIGTVVKEEINICDVNVSEFTIECPGLFGYFSALFMMVIAFLLTLFYPLYLLDFVLRAGIIAVIMPFLMFAWVFPITRGFVNMAFQMVLNMCIGVMILTLLLVGVVSVMDMIVMNTYLTDAGNPIDIQNIAQYGSTLTDKLVGKAPQIQFIGFLQMVFTGVIALFMIKQSSHITNAFANVSELDSVGAAFKSALMKTVSAAVTALGVAADVVGVAGAIFTGGASVVAAQGAKGLAKAGVAAVAKGTIKQGLKSGGNEFKKRMRNRVYQKTARTFKYTDASGNRRKLKYNVYNQYRNSALGKAAKFANGVRRNIKNL
ncbi:MAG: hypothetical protein GY804_13460 [Alphaproteobacteria bacterium]|nr:hypothetical protein [Alphaproteobacteria bacterium]